MAHRTGQNRQQFGLPSRMTIAPGGRDVHLFFEVFDLAAPAERHTPNQQAENVGVVWHRRVDHSAAVAVRA